MVGFADQAADDEIIFLRLEAEFGRGLGHGTRRDLGIAAFAAGSWPIPAIAPRVVVR